MKKKLILLIILLIPIAGLFALEIPNKSDQAKIDAPQKSHWLVLHRKTGREFLYYGVLGDTNNSKLVREFQVKTGGFNSPTPLPQLLGREYWLVTKKESSADNPETAPYFIQLDIPVTEDWPYGPAPYEECRDPFTGGKTQCDWVLPGYFGLHGVNGRISKLSKKDLGSSGCVRHSDSDITYLFNLLNPEKEEIRYYIQDS